MILASNVFSEDKTERVLMEVLKFAYERISKTYGPGGKTTFVQIDQENHLITKDGFHCLNAMVVNDPMARTFLSILQSISFALVTTVGDGSTSCIIAAYHFCLQLKEMLSHENIRQKDLLDALNKIVEMIINTIKENAVPISEDLHELKSIASVSLNNNDDLGKIIFDLYEKVGVDGFISVKLGNTPETKTEVSDGYQIFEGLYADDYVNSDTGESILNDSAVLVFDAAINNDSNIRLALHAFKVVNAEAIEAQSKGLKPKYTSLTIIAPNFNDAFIGTMNLQLSKIRQAGFVPNVNIIKFTKHTKFDEEVLQDIAIVSGAHVVMNSINAKIDPNTIKNYFGYCEQIICGRSTTTMFGYDTNEDQLESTLGFIEGELKELAENHIEDIKRTYELKKRQAMLQRKLAKIYVGGLSEHQRKSDKELIDDAIAACHSALVHGYVVGGNLSVLFAADKLAQEFSHKDASSLSKSDRLIMNLLPIMQSSFRAVYKTLLINDLKDEAKVNEIIEHTEETHLMYDLVREKYDDENKIINSAETEYEVLKNAISIISLVLTCNQFVGMVANEQFADI